MSQDLMINKRNKVVSKKQHEKGLIAFKNLEAFIKNKNKPNTIKVQTVKAKNVQ